MATYTAVVSLMQDLDQLSSSFHLLDKWFCPFTKTDIKILIKHVSSMHSLLRDSSGQSYNHELINHITENRIRCIARKAGTFIDFWAVQCHPNQDFVERRYVGKGPTMNEITEEICCINRDLKKFLDAAHRNLEDSSTAGKSFTPLNPSRRTPTEDVKLVGLEHDLAIMLDRLTGLPAKLKVFPISGMGGIGKTTFAKALYDNPFVMYHFHVRAWITVSQQYQVREMLLGILSCISNISDEICERSDELLKEQVYKCLKGKRYLLVFDDMWDIIFWDDLKRIFPDEKNGSRIIVTSRIKDVVVRASPDTPVHSLRCLNENESWELLCSKIFENESCPPELVGIGKEIVRRCQGLPLAIVVVGGLLFKKNLELGVWEKVAESVGSLVMEEADHCQNILALSYNHLPDYLKVCFLYMGIFPEDYEISVKRLMMLWIAEGFIWPDKVKSLEEVAEDYLEDLVSRSLVLVKRNRCDGRIKTCYIHDLMIDLCLKESRKQDFLHVIKRFIQLPSKDLHDNNLVHMETRKIPLHYLHNLRRVSFDFSLRQYINTTSLPYTRTVVCFEKLTFSDSRRDLGLNLKLLKVLDIMHLSLKGLPKEILDLTQLKYLALTIQGSLMPMLLFEIHSLQTLIADCEWDGRLTNGFWKMSKLRHLQVKRCFLSSIAIGFESVLDFSNVKRPLGVLKHLQSLSTIRPISCTKEVFLSMPNLKKLGVHETEEDYKFRGWFQNLAYLPELEMLKYVFSNPFVSAVLRPDRFLSSHVFPPKLVKLTLSGTSLAWEGMFKLSTLPKLEVLKLRNYAFSGPVWKSSKGGFLCLKFLLVGSTDLEVWEAEGTHFPSLQRLVLRHCRSLKEIPYGVGDAPLLECIELHCCKETAVTSARQLQQEQQSLGNDGIKLHITDQG